MTELEGESVSLKRAQRKRRCAYQDAELEREQDVPPSPPKRGRPVCRNGGVLTSGDELQSCPRKGRRACNSCDSLSSGDWLKKPPRRERLDYNN